MPSSNCQTNNKTNVLDSQILASTTPMPFDSTEKFPCDFTIGQGGVDQYRLKGHRLLKIKIKPQIKKAST